jgi:hypothetical protein
MAKSRPYRDQPLNCSHCGEPVRNGSDYLRAHLQGACALFHWQCFIALMRENDQRNADGGAVREQ